MQQGGHYGGGYPPPINPDPSFSYERRHEAPLSASSFDPTAPLSTPPVSPFISHSHSSFSSDSYGPPPNSSVPNEYSSPLSYGNSYTPSYAPVVPSYAAVGSPYDSTFEIAVGLAPPPISVDAQHPSQYVDTSYGVAAEAPARYDTYDPGRWKYSSEREQAYGGSKYEQGKGYERNMYTYDPEHYVNGGGASRDYDSAGFPDVYAYDGGGSEIRGSRGAGDNSWAEGISGTSRSFNSSRDTLGSGAKITRSMPTVDANVDSAGSQKFRVKLLPEPRSNDSVKEVLCQIGLDGVRMVDPNTNRTLRIYPLDTITKWEVKEPSLFTFWAKSAVDVDQRIIQLKSSNHITTSILDTLTAACVQLCEMVGKDGANDGSKPGVRPGTNIDTSTNKKGSVLDWVALRPRAVSTEEKQHWVPDEAVTKCVNCEREFGAFLRRHHCRNCGYIFCDKCTQGRIALTADEDSQPVRVCDHCLAEVTHRLENSIKGGSKVSTPKTHEDLAKKLQEELERTHIGRKPVLSRSSSGQGSSGQTSVLNCAKCGSVTIVKGNSTVCVHCGADSGNGSAVAEKSTGVRLSSGPSGPPHLWSSNAKMSDESRMREFACPTCTVHLQVQVPRVGTETVECGVCQHPFLVSAEKP